MANKTEKEKKEPEVVAENEEVNASAEEVKQITPLQSAAEQKVDNDAKALTTQNTQTDVNSQVVADTSTVDAAMQKLDSQLQPYNNQWQTLRNDAVTKLQNRDPFSYDLNGDIIYQQYADIYGRNAEKSMKDTVGKVSALSGGFGNSYAQTAGQQAYSDTMSGLNDIVPELYQLAQSRYDQEGQELKDMLSIYQGLDESEYGRYRDTVADEQWRTQFEESVREYNETAAFNQMTFEESVREYNETAAFNQMTFEESKREFDKTFSLEEKQQLYNSGMAKIMMDKQPNEAECAALGVTPEGAREMRQKYKAQNTPVVTSTSTSTKYDIDDTINRMKYVDELFTTYDYETASRRLTENYSDLGLTYEQLVEILANYQPKSYKWPFS